MGIAPYKTFTFDGVSSADYGVYITGEGVFNAPERAVEMVDIPGRNGSYALDQGRFGNIEVTYTAGMVDDSETNFADRLANVRNWLCSKKGYVRLEDDYNPDEYRMAVYSSGISVEHADLRTGEFEISFDCKPQRWLTSGETATAVANNGTLTNPTRFDAEPLLVVKGSGSLSFNGYNIDLQNAPIGKIAISNSIQTNPRAGGYGNQTVQFYGSFFNAHDDLVVSGYKVTFENLLRSGCELTSATYGTTTNCRCELQENGRYVTLYVDDLTFHYGDGNVLGEDKQASVQVNWAYTDNGVANSLSATLYCHVKYYPNSDQFLFKNDAGITTTPFYNWKSSMYVPAIYGISSVSALGNPTYIDCEIGEAYMYKGGNIVSSNSAVTLGSDLPKLAPGANTITFDNTVTELKIHPRWWRV